MTLSPPNSAAIKILFFAAAHELTGTRAEDVALDQCKDLVSLRLWLLERWPSLEAILPSCLISINLETVSWSDAGKVALEAGDEVALIPPVSGG
jgi:molybdopterin converting factor small subunit